MRGNGPWKRRGFAVAAIAFLLAAAALETAAPVSAAPSPTGIALNPRPAGQLQATGPVATAKAKALAKAKAKAKARARAIARAKAKRSSLSLPELLLFAVAPFVLMAGFLLGADALRRRPPKKHRASLVITRVSNR